MLAAYGNGISKELLDQIGKFINLYDTTLSDKGKDYRFAGMNSDRYNLCTNYLFK